MSSSESWADARCTRAAASVNAIEADEQPTNSRYTLAALGNLHETKAARRVERVHSGGMQDMLGER